MYAACMTYAQSGRYTGVHMVGTAQALTSVFAFLVQALH